MHLGLKVYLFHLYQVLLILCVFTESFPSTVSICFFRSCMHKIYPPSLLELISTSLLISSDSANDAKRSGFGSCAKICHNGIACIKPTSASMNLVSFQYQVLIINYGFTADGALWRRYQREHLHCIPIWCDAVRVSLDCGKLSVCAIFLSPLSKIEYLGCYQSSPRPFPSQVFDSCIKNCKR